MPEIPIRRVLIFDYGGLQVVVRFGKKLNHNIITEWSEELSLRAAKFVAMALRKKADGIEFILLRRNLAAHIGSKYIIAMEYDKLPLDRVKKLAEKLDKLLTSMETIDPRELGAATARAIKAEFGT